MEINEKEAPKTEIEKSIEYSEIQMERLKSNLRKHLNIKKQTFQLLRIIKQLLIHKLFLHLDYLILIQQVSLSLIGMKVKMINKNIFYFLAYN